ncbi:14520_t:CDS:2, partial [Cetraspora pellucida]
MTGIESMLPVLVLTPTGVAAFNINDRMIHSALSITINSTNNFDIDKLTVDDWRILNTQFKKKLTRAEHDQFSDAIFILPRWSDVNAVNIDKFRLLNVPIAKINTKHTSGVEVKRADSDTAHGFEVQLLLTRGTIHDILFEEPGSSCIPTAVFINFDDYKDPTVTNVEGEKISVYLAWTIMVYKSQRLILPKAFIDLGGKEFAAGLSFVTTSQVYTLKDLLFKLFSFERLQRIKECKRLQERKKEKK